MSSPLTDNVKSSRCGPTAVVAKTDSRHDGHGVTDQAVPAQPGTPTDSRTRADPGTGSDHRPILDDRVCLDRHIGLELNSAPQDDGRMEAGNGLGLREEQGKQPGEREPWVVDPQHGRSWQLERDPGTSQQGADPDTDELVVRRLVSQEREVLGSRDPQWRHARYPPIGASLDLRVHALCELGDQERRHMLVYCFIGLVAFELPRYLDGIARPRCSAATTGPTEVGNPSRLARQPPQHSRCSRDS